MIGTEKQCHDLVRHISDLMEDDPGKIWDTNIFGKSLHELVSDNISGKLSQMPENIFHGESFHRYQTIRCAGHIPDCSLQNA